MSMRVNGWELYCTRLFQKILNELEKDVTTIKRESPETYQSHPKYKLLCAVYKIIVQEVPMQPNTAKYTIRKETLEKRKKIRKTVGNWYRAKKGRNRVFFQFSDAVKIIIYVWINDEASIRKSGDKNDVYKVFKRLLDKNVIATDFNSLLRDSNMLKSTEYTNLYLSEGRHWK